MTSSWRASRPHCRSRGRPSWERSGLQLGLGLGLGLRMGGLKWVGLPRGQYIFLLSRLPKSGENPKTENPKTENPKNPKTENPKTENPKNPKTENPKNPKTENPENPKTQKRKTQKWKNQIAVTTCICLWVCQARVVGRRRVRARSLRPSRGSCRVRSLDPTGRCDGTLVS